MDKELTNKVTSLSYDEKAGCVFLYPDIQKGFWITYESNGGSYVAPQFFTANGATAPTAPTRSGYTFTGWFTDSTLAQQADFSEFIPLLKLQKLKTLYSSLKKEVR